MKFLMVTVVLAAVLEYGCAIPPVQCSPPRCAPGCQARRLGGPCPECDCQGAFREQRCPRVEVCGAGCKNAYDIRGCQYCQCSNVQQPPSIQCDPPKCDYPCVMDYSTQPCPSCKCDRNNQRIPQGVQCDPPRCEYPCRIDYSTQPCPSCKCERNNQGNRFGVQCDPPKCDYPCRMDYSTKPCPSCKCDGNSNNQRPQCSPPKCDYPCRLLDAYPCPTCDCGNNGGRPAMVQCTTPKCNYPCRLNYRTKPCPSCQC